MTRLSSTFWGELPGGARARLFTLSNTQGMKVAISDLGATLVSWQAPDRAGQLGEIVLGYDTPDSYVTSICMGLVGRWANRIAGACFELDGVRYTLDDNESGNLLHGGFTGFHQALWQAREDGNTLVMRLESAAGQAGFPGNVVVQVSYSLDDDGVLTMDYEASTDAPTPLNLTNHPYFNLSGQPGSDICAHEVWIDADTFFEVDAAMIPSREAQVNGTAFDFRHSASIGERLAWSEPQFAYAASGFDHCYVLRKNNASNADPSPYPSPLVARAYDPNSGRSLSVYTDQRGLQLYTGNRLQGVHGRGGVIYPRYAGLCLEAGGFPNQINMADREGVMVRPGSVYRQRTYYGVQAV